MIKTDDVIEFENKKFYRDELDYDWTLVTDKISGPETFFHRFRQHLICQLLKNEDKKHKYLDAGCGTGLLLRHLPEGSTGLDISKKAINKAKIYAPLTKLVVGDIMKMPFKDHCFDIVLCTEVIEHLPSTELATNEIKRVLKKRGKLIGTVPRESILWNFQKFSKTGPKIPYHKHYASNDEVRKMLKGFKILLLRKACWGLLYVFVAQEVSD